MLLRTRKSVFTESRKFCKQRGPPSCLSCVKRSGFYCFWSWQNQTAQHYFVCEDRDSAVRNLEISYSEASDGYNLGKNKASPASSEW